MKKYNNFLIGLLIVLFAVSTAYAFDLGDVLKELEPPKKEEKKNLNDNKKKDEAPKKKTNIFGEVLGALQAFEPIGYKEERVIGGSLATEIFSRFGGRYSDPALEKYIALVGNTMVGVTERAEMPFHFAILNSSDPNAFAAPGGYVFVSVGLLRKLRNEAELAGVLGHEIAHITNRHALKMIETDKQNQVLKKGVSQVTESLLGDNPEFLDGIMSGLTNAMFTTGLPTKDEYDADRTGMDFAHQAGYYPAGLRDFLKVLGDRSAILSKTHPSSSRRISRLTTQLNSSSGDYKSAALAPTLTKRFQDNTKGKL
jgi:predicted Zn-dependent protease